MMGITAWMNAHAKAIVAGLTTALYLYFSLRSDGLSAGDIEAIIFAALTAGGATWAIPNSISPTILMAPPTITHVIQTDGTTTQIATASPVVVAEPGPSNL